MNDTAKPQRPKVQYKRVAGKDHVPPPSPTTVRRRRAAEINSPPPKPEKAPKPPTPKRERSPLDLYKKSDTSDVKGVNDTARAIVDALVWEGLTRSAAAEKAGVSASYARRLLRSPDVMAHYLAELDVLRTSGKARLVHRLEELTEQDDNQTAAVGAAKVLLSMDAPGKGGAGPTVNVAVMSPGWVIDCTAALSGRRQPAELSQINSNHLIDMHPVPSIDRNAPAEAPQPALEPPASAIAMSAAPSRSPPGWPTATHHSGSSTGGGGVRDLAALRGGVGGKTGSSSSSS